MFSFKFITILIIIKSILSLKYLDKLNGPLDEYEQNLLNSNITVMRNIINEFKLANHSDSFICKSCLYTFNNLHNLIYKYYNKIGLFEILTFVCDNLFGLTHNACKGYIEGYGPVIVSSILEHYLNGEYICTYLNVCKYKHFVTLNADDYAKELLKDKPEVNIPKSEGKKLLNVLHVTDIHTDLLYQVDSLGKCPDPSCCRGEIISGPFRAGKWGYVGKCDLPFRTLENFVENASKLKPDFIIWTGDNPSHAEWDSKTDDEIKNVTKLFTQLLKDNNFTVYPSLGNHEKYPSDQFDYFNLNKEKPMLQFFAQIWKDWLGDSYDEFIKYGFYSKLHSDSNLRIVSYNCLYCDIVNFYLINDPTDPGNQISWLEQTLRNSERNGELVYFIGHIPAGDTSLVNECAKRIKAILDRFSHIIRGQFGGHTHYDEVKIIHEYFDNNKISGVSFIAPSLTTSMYLNPSFRVFEVDAETKFPLDYLQYRLNLTKANELISNPEWEISYRASQQFNVKDLTDLEGIKTFVNNILIDKNIYERAKRAFFADGPLIEEHKNISKYLACRFGKDLFSDFFDCIKWISWNSEDYGFKFLNFMSGKWFMKLPHNSDEH